MSADATAAVRRNAMLEKVARPVQHELNNLLTVILANLDLLRRSATEGAPRRQIDRVGEATRRLDASTKALLGLVRRPVGRIAPFDAVAAVDTLRPLLLLLVPTPAALTIQAPPDPIGPVRADRAALEEALLHCAAAVTGDGRIEIALDVQADGPVVRVGVTGDVPPTLTGTWRDLLGGSAAADGTLRVHLPYDAPAASA